MKKTFISVSAFVLSLMMLVSSASACTSLYVGSALTTDGTILLSRSEDLANNYNKMQFVIEPGVHKAGEVYNGCYGFTYTFTHDSYGYTAFQDDNMYGVDNVCPDCGGTHLHTPYQEGGTNEKGLTVSSSEAMTAVKEILALEPFEADGGIDQAEIPTILLSECSTAKEALDMLMNFYDTVGTATGSGLWIFDKDEAYYIENGCSHQYLAIKLNDTLVMVQPNMCALGLIDLDDENVYASAGLIATAKAAGTYVGDEEANTINISASYFNRANQKQSTRMTNVLNFLQGVDTFTSEEGNYGPEAFTVTNVGADGSIVPLNTAIKLDHAMSLEDVLAYYHVSGVSNTGNLETHIYNYVPGSADPTDIQEWVAMATTGLSVFVPYLPMLTNDVYEGLKVSTATAYFTTEKPTEGAFYPTTGKVTNEAGEKVTVDGYMVMPSDWADSVYWTMNVLANLYLNDAMDQTAKDMVDAALAGMQDVMVDQYLAEGNGVLAAVKALYAAGDIDAAKALVTNTAYIYSEDAHLMSVKLVKAIMNGLYD